MNANDDLIDVLDQVEIGDFISPAFLRTRKG